MLLRVRGRERVGGFIPPTPPLKGSRHMARREECAFSIILECAIWQEPFRGRGGIDIPRPRY